MSLPRVDLVAIRDHLPGDRSFILATWLRGAYYGDSWFSQIPKNIFMKHYHDILEKFLTNPSVSVKVACLRDDTDVILGYSVSRRLPDGEGILDWIFVKSAWRQIGIGKSLLPSNWTTATHMTKLGKSLKPPTVVFNPFT